MTAPGCLVVFYHYVRDAARTPLPGIRALRPEGFRAQLDWLQARYDVIDGPAFERALVERRPFVRPTALLTFDDGFTDHYTHVFPELRARGLGGVFFVAGATLADRPALLNVHKTHALLSHLGAETLAAEVREGVVEATAVAGAGAARDGVYRYDGSPETFVKRLLNYELPYPVADAVLETLFARHLGDAEAFARELYLTPAQIGKMARGGMTFGFHTERHRVLSRLDRGQQHGELARGAALVRGLTGQAAVPFCYPYGFPHTYNADTHAVLRDVGYTMAFNTVRRVARPEHDPPYEIPRVDTRDVPPEGQAVPLA